MANGSKVVRSNLLASKPSALATAASALSEVNPLSTNPCCKVVNGLMVVEPAGAFSSPEKGFPVERSVPPVAVMVPKTPGGRVKLPLASVVVTKSGCPSI